MWYRPRAPAPASPGAGRSFVMRHEQTTRDQEHCDACRDLAGCPGCTARNSVAPVVPCSGLAVVGGAFGLFVLPVLLAVGGALLARGSAVAQLAGGLSGLVMGMALAWLGHRALTRKTKGDDR